MTALVGSGESPELAARHRRQTTGTSRPERGPGRWAGWGLPLLGAVAALGAHRVVGSVGALTWAVAFGAATTNLRLLPGAATAAMRAPTRRLLRAGVALLGFSLPLTATLSLGLPVITVVVVTLLGTLAGTFWIARRLSVGRPRALLLATGFAICGASAVAAMEQTAEADEDDVAAAIAMVTVFGSVLMVALPLVQQPLSMSEHTYGIWAGAAVQEVGQVIAAAGPAGATALAVAVLVKLTRVLLLAPVVAAVGLAGRRSCPDDRSGGGSGPARQPPIVPLFVLGFVAAAALRATGLLPDSVLDVITSIQAVALAAALFGMGAGVHLGSLARGSAGTLTAAALSTLMVAGLSLAGVLLIA